MTESIRDFASDPVRLQDWTYSTATQIQEEFRAAGYHLVQTKILGREGEWQEIHRWCREHIGERNYSWTGSTFWFETERDAVLFALRWA